MAISSPGLGSGLDVTSIVTQLMQLERRPIALLDNKEVSFQAKLSAFGAFKGVLSSFQGAVRGLAEASRFTAVRSSSSDASVAAASGGSAASVGSYAIEVTKLAQAQKLAAAGQASSSAAIGTGTLTFDFGTITGGTFDAPTGKYTGAGFTPSGSASKSVTIDAAHASLEGIRDAINAANIGVTASLVNDGSASPHRLLLSAANGGAPNAMRISVAGDAGLAALLAHNPAGTQALSQTVAAQNAELKIDGLTISKPSNVVTDAIQGVTLSLAKVGTTTVGVARDTAGVKSAIDGFVKAYNDLNKSLSDLTRFDSATRKASVLTGDGTVRSVLAQIRTVISSALSTAGGGLTTLTDIGIAFQVDGTLKLDAAKLDKALADPTKDVATLFAAVGKPSDPLVRFSSATQDTRNGSYALALTQIATQGQAVGSQAAGLTITAGVNDALDVSIDGIAAQVTLTAGTYTAATLVSELQAKLNGATALASAGVKITATQSAGVLTVTSDRYGATSKVGITGGNAAAGLFGTAVSTDGTDVAGTIGGTTATGSGQTLSAVSGDPRGLAVTVTGGTTGERGTIAYARGIAYELDKLVGRMLEDNGAVDSRIDGLDASIKDIGKRREALEARMVLIEKRFRTQFSALDTLISSMNQTSAFLQQQLGNLPKPEGT
jgi:flagellar hook-associated protein 2